MEKKINEVAKLQKKVKVDVKLKVKEKRYKEKAKNLNELVQGVKRKKIKKKLTNFSKVKFPVQGKIISNFGEGKDIRKSKNGLVFKVIEDSFVTSPINGMVVYANQFRSYGNLIIIESKNEYHSILAGMDEILTNSGNEVLVGEPIAKNYLNYSSWYK